MTAAAPDFLSRVAAKAVGALPLVEPRLPSRFESDVANAGRLAGGGEEPLERIEEVEQSWSASSLRRTITRAAPADAPREPLETDELPTPSPRRRARSKQGETEAPAPASDLIEERPSIAAQPRPVAEQASKMPSPVPALLAPPDVRLEVQRIVDRTHAATPEPAPVAPAPREEARQELEKRTVRDEDPARVVATPTATFLAPQKPPVPRAQPRTPEILPRVARRDSDSDSDSNAAPPPMPVINITIGRIDVRAHTTATTAAAPRPQAPQREAPQSLADYLSQRSAR
ncbi:MAG: hypothetical protein ABW023_14625 [Sphingomonas sp.]